MSSNRTSLCNHVLARRRRGFTLIEMVSVLIIVAILAFVALPRFFNRNTFDTRAFYDQAIAMVRYAQKQAIAQQRPVFVNVTTDKVLCLTYTVDAQCNGANNVVNRANNGPFRQTAPAGVTLTPAQSFSFDALGSPGAATLTLSVVGDGTRTITVERETGYVH